MPRSDAPLFWAAVARDVIPFVIATGTGIFVWYRKRGARHWPISHGRVEFGMTSDEGGWKSNLSYSYSVEGQFYSGVLPLKAKNESDADDQTHQWHGQNVAVRYSPRNPSISVVRLEDQAPLMGESLGRDRHRLSE
jgi:hypothetical protein